MMMSLSNTSRNKYYGDNNKLSVITIAMMMRTMMPAQTVMVLMMLTRPIILVLIKTIDDDVGV